MIKLLKILNKIFQIPKIIFIYIIEYELLML